MAHILAICCANGVGHVRRVVGILSRLRVLRPHLTIDLVCEDWQVQRLSAWSRLADLLAGGMRVLPGVTAPGVQWASDPALYAGGQLVGWEDRLGSLETLQTADCVLSDNLVAVLDHRPDAVLSGSFLWGDVLANAYPSNEAVQNFARRDRARLARHRPPMLCVEDLAMPAVQRMTEAIPLPWMCEEPELSGGTATPRPAQRPQIALAGGATGAARKVLGSVAAALVAAVARDALDVDLAVPPNLHPWTGGLAAERLHPFQRSTFTTAAVMVCRPGTGTLTDCVAHRLPLMAVHEPNNPEMAHNGRRVAELGLGHYLETPHPEGAVQKIQALLAPSTHARVRGTMAGLQIDGLQRAAGWLAQHRIPE